MFSSIFWFYCHYVFNLIAIICSSGDSNADSVCVKPDVGFILAANILAICGSGKKGAAGVTGCTLPCCPSIVLILLGDVISSSYQEAQNMQGIFSQESVSVGDLFAGAIFPGLILVGFYILFILFVNNFFTYRPQ